MPNIFNLFNRNKPSTQFAYDSTLDYSEEPLEISTSGTSKNLPPPPYSSSSKDPSMSSLGRQPSKRSYFRTPLSQESLDEALVALRAYDIVILLDDSGSMRSHWDEARAALADIAEVASKYDQDGIDIHFLNRIDLDKRVHTNLTKSAQVENLFERVKPGGPTPLGDRLDELLREYLDRLEAAKSRSRKGFKEDVKRVNFIVITDGAPTDDPEPPILDAARRLAKGKFPLAQLGIQFVQIGNSRSASRFLQTLDDDLSKEEGVRDIVDTTPYFGENLTRDILIKIMLGGINRKFDAQPNRKA